MVEFLKTVDWQRATLHGGLADEVNPEQKDVAENRTGCAEGRHAPRRAAPSIGIRRRHRNLGKERRLSALTSQIVIESAAGKQRQKPGFSSRFSSPETFDTES